MTFQGIPKVSMELLHYQDDVFARHNVHRDDDMKASMFPSWKIPKQKIAFLSSGDGHIDRFTWQHGSYLSSPEVFAKDRSGSRQFNRALPSGRSCESFARLCLN